MLVSGQQLDSVDRPSVWTQITYGATIASFLGGIHWGAAMLDPRRKVLAVLNVVWQMCSACIWVAQRHKRTHVLVHHFDE